MGRVELSECIRRITTILVKLREHIAETSRAWAKFSNAHGDIAYFHDLSDPIADEAIASMRGTFTDLLGFEQKIGSMEENCRVWAKMVS